MILKPRFCVRKYWLPASHMSRSISRSCGSSVTSSNNLFDAMLSIDSRGTGEEAGEDAELPDRAE